MPAVCRVGDSLSTGHDCVGTTTIASSNTDNTVRANGIPIIVVDAPTVAHPAPPNPPCDDHVAFLNVGSSTVRVNSISIGRKNDSADLGKMTGGSDNVFSG